MPRHLQVTVCLCTNSLTLPEAAVKALELVHDLVFNGIVGPKTWAVIFDKIRSTR